MSEPRLIRKYANRRLYDTTTSSHVRLSEVREFIRQGEDVRIVDDVSGDDITRTILFQIIADEERASRPILDEALLTRLIRLSGNPAQEMMGDYLLRSFDAFMQQQVRLQEQMREAMTSAPLDTFNEVMKANLETFERFQRVMMGANQTPPPDEPEEDDEPSK